MQGPDLPIAIGGHAMIQMKNDMTIFIGGYESLQGISAQTFIYNHYYGNWSSGPELNKARYKHAAGIVGDEITQEKLAIVAGGFGNSMLKSSEILISDTWSLGRERSTLGWIKILPFHNIYIVTCQH